MIAQAVIMQAFRRIGQVRPGYVSSPELLADALTEWILGFDELGAERNTQFSNPWYQYLVNGPGSQTGGNGYLIGPTATTAPATPTTLPGGPNDFNGPRPNAIIRANCVLTNQGPQPVYIQMRPVSQEEWASLAIQQIPGVNVTSLYWYDPKYPNGVFNVFPPLTGNSIQIYQWGVLVPPANLAADYEAPPGYADAVVAMLAERLYYMATKEVCVRASPYNVIAGKAKRAWDKIRAVNRPINRIRNDFPKKGHTDGFFDSFVTYTGEPY